MPPDEPIAVVTGAEAADRYDGETAHAIASRLSLPRVVLYASVGSTMDVAHACAAKGAAAGTLFLADAQTRGRGRHGNDWCSPSARGIWLTMLERPTDAAAIEVLSLRVGLRVAVALAAFVPASVQLKWPNDLYTAGGKLAGILVEARWHGDQPDWVAIGVGVNVVPPDDMVAAAGLRERTSRLEVITALVPALRVAASRPGPLTAAELSDFAARDAARGRRCTRPSAGVVAGLTATGELIVDTRTGPERHRSGSLVLEEGA